ncbi:MAG TPA: HNH endonuclease [Polyangiaceae bacterium]
MAPDVVARFWAKVEKTDACWLWTAGKDWDGYGLFSLPRGLFGRARSVRATRFVWELHHGAPPGKALVCHRCDTPACVNPAHLFLGTPKDNFHDCLAKGRYSPKGAGNAAAKLTAEDVVKIRNLYASGGWSQQALAHIFGVKQTAVSNVVKRRTWAHVPDNDAALCKLKRPHAA